MYAISLITLLDRVARMNHDMKGLKHKSESIFLLDFSYQTPLYKLQSMSRP